MLTGTARVDRPPLRAGDNVAVKVVRKPASRRAAAERVPMLRAEVEILRSIRHPNIVPLYEVFESETKVSALHSLNIYCTPPATPPSAHLPSTSFPQNTSLHTSLHAPRST